MWWDVEIGRWVSGALALISRSGHLLGPKSWMALAASAFARRPWDSCLHVCPHSLWTSLKTPGPGLYSVSRASLPWGRALVLTPQSPQRQASGQVMTGSFSEHPGNWAKASPSPSLGRNHRNFTRLKESGSPAHAGSHRHLQPSRPQPRQGCLPGESHHWATLSCLTPSLGCQVLVSSRSEPEPHSPAWVKASADWGTRRSTWPP